MQYFMPIYQTLIGAIITLLVTKVKDLLKEKKATEKKEDDFMETLKESMTILLRARLFDYYEKYEHSDTIPASEWADIEQTHACYNKYEGNDIGDRIYQELLKKHLGGVK